MCFMLFFSDQGMEKNGLNLAVSFSVNNTLSWSVDGAKFSDTIWGRLEYPSYYRESNSEISASSSFARVSKIALWLHFTSPVNIIQPGNWRSWRTMFQRWRGRWAGVGWCNSGRCLHYLTPSPSPSPSPSPIIITNHHHGLTACSHQDKILPWWEYVNHMHLHDLHEAPINLHSNCFKLLGEGFCSPGKSLPCCWVSVEPEVIGGDFLGDDGDHDDDMVELWWF